MFFRMSCIKYQPITVTDSCRAENKETVEKVRCASEVWEEQVTQMNGRMSKILIRLFPDPNWVYGFSVFFLLPPFPYSPFYPFLSTALVFSQITFISYAKNKVEQAILSLIFILFINITLLSWLTHSIYIYTVFS